MNPSVLNVHTPTASFAILHSLTEETIGDLYRKLERKAQGEFGGLAIGPGWVKYEFNDSIWNLDDDSDYAIFTWRQRDTKSGTFSGSGEQSNIASSSRSTLDGYASSSSFMSPGPTFSSPPRSIVSLTPAPPPTATPTLHVHNPLSLLPSREAYHNPSFYLFHPSRVEHLRTLLAQTSITPQGAPNSSHPERHQPAVNADTGSVRRAGSTRSKKASTIRSIGSGLTKGIIIPQPDGTGIPKLRKDFEKFHSENGVRTVVGSIGPVENVRMLLKATHKHVYISRSFAKKHGFIPSDSKPGNYGYAGMISIGEWPVTLQPSRTQQPTAVQSEDHAPYSAQQISGTSNINALPANGAVGGGGPGSVHSASGQHRYKTIAESIADSYVEFDKLPRAPSGPPSASLRQGSIGRSGSAFTNSGSGNSTTYKTANPSPAGTPRASSPSVGAGTSNLVQTMRAPHESLASSSPRLAGSGVQSIRSVASVSSKHPFSTKPNQGSVKPSYEQTAPRNGLKPVMVEVYVSEEPHFDVVLGRTFFEKRSIKINEGDLTDVWCLDTGEKIECEVVILKDGRGEIVTVT